MNRFFVLFVIVNVLVVILGGFFAYSDLNLRQYDTRQHLNTTVDVEYAPLLYRPTYEYYDVRSQEIIVGYGSWALDFFQSTILVMVIVDSSWLI